MKPLMLSLSLLALCLAAPARAGTTKRKRDEKPVPAVEEGRKVQFKDYDPDTGDLRLEIEAATAKQDPRNPRVLVATRLRLIKHHKGRKHVVTGDTGRFDTVTKDVSLEGHVVLTVDDKSAARVETSQVYWHDQLGIATTERLDPAARRTLLESPTPTKILEERVRKSRIRVHATSHGVTTEGYGLLVSLASARAVKREGGRTDRLMLGKDVRSEIRPQRSGWLLGGDEAPTRPAPPPVAPGRAKAAKPAAKPRGPIVIRCRGPLVIHREDMSAVYNGTARPESDNASDRPEGGQVHVTQDEQTLTCRTLTITFRTVRDPGTKKAKPALDSVTAHGQVRIDSGADFATGDVAAWHNQDGFALLTGTPATITWDNGTRLAAGRVRRKSRRVRTNDGVKTIVEWLECSRTTAYPHSVYLHGRVSTDDVLARAEKPDAPAKAAQDR